MLLRLPLITPTWVALQIPDEGLSEREWLQMFKLLRKMKPGIVRRVEQPETQEVSATN